MSSKAIGQRAGVLLMTVWCLALNGWRAGSADSSAATPCAAPEYRQFDFWIGDWDAFDEGNPNTVVARTRVDRILDGCVLLEDYQDTNGHKGQSFSIYDSSTKEWHQSWVTNRGQLLLLDGGMQGNEMVLTAVERVASGKERKVRGTWKRADDGVREIAVISMDGGRSWQPWFDLHFRRHKAVSI